MMTTASAAGINITHTGTAQYLTDGDDPDAVFNVMMPQDEDIFLAETANAVKGRWENDLAGLNHYQSPHPSVLDPDSGYPTCEIRYYEFDTIAPGNHDNCDAILQGNDLEGSTDTFLWLTSEQDGLTDNSRGFRRSEATHSDDYHPLTDNISLDYSDHPHVLVFDSKRRNISNAFLSCWLRVSEYSSYFSGTPPARNYAQYEDELCEAYLVEDNFWSANEYEASYLIQWAPNKADAINNGNCNVKGEDMTVQDEDDVQLRHHSYSTRPYVHPFSSCTSNAIQDTIEWMGWNI